MNLNHFNYIENGVSRYITEMLPSVKLSVTEQLAQSYTHVREGFLYIYRLDHELRSRSLIMEAGPGDIIPPIGVSEIQERKILVEQVGSPRINMIHNQMVMPLLDGRRGVLNQILNKSGQIIPATQVLNDIRNIPEEYRLGSIIAKYTDLPFWQSIRGIISLPPMHHLAKIIDVQESSLRKHLQDLLRMRCVARLPVDDREHVCAGRLNLEVKEEQRLLKSSKINNWNNYRVLTVGTGCEYILQELNNLVGCVHEHHDDILSALHSMYCHPRRYSLIVIGSVRQGDMQPYEVLLMELRGGVRKKTLQSILRRAIVLCRPEDAEHFNMATGYRVAVKELGCHKAHIFRALSCLMDRQQECKNSMRLNNVVPFKKMA